MFAILISEENMPDIADSGVFDKQPVSNVSLYLNRPRPWYFIRGYVTLRGTLDEWAVLPAYMLEETFDYDPDKIKTDWTNLVRKESP